MVYDGHSTGALKWLTMTVKRYFRHMINYNREKQNKNKAIIKTNIQYIGRRIGVLFLACIRFIEKREG